MVANNSYRTLQKDDHSDKLLLIINQTLLLRIQQSNLKIETVHILVYLFNYNIFERRHELIVDDLKS